jgi:hypothetical protein
MIFFQKGNSYTVIQPFRKRIQKRKKKINRCEIFKATAKFSVIFPRNSVKNSTIDKADFINIILIKPSINIGFYRFSKKNSAKKRKENL